VVGEVTHINMTPLFPTLLTFIVCLVSWGLTGWFRRQALAHFLLDVPNSRSSHTVATPRGGGVAIVLSTLVALLALGWMDRLDWPSVWSLSGGGALVALIGFVDDRGHVAPRWRLIGHFAAASLVLAIMGGVPHLTAMGFVLGSGWLGLAIAALYIVWMLNLTNFMDGIDGIAGVETITVCLSAVFLSEVVGPGKHLWIAPLVLASATLGFLVWNWPPAKIFMGDAGSGFLGLMLAALSLQAGWVANRLFWSWVILLGVFVVDATVTLIRRMARGEKFYEAHRSHAYQHAAIRQGAHMPVTVAVGVINLCWLLPVALLVALGRLDGFLGVLIAYAPLAVVAVRLGAGRPSTA
jgi:Fuc2NAc and GlcNAc transferase